MKLSLKRFSLFLGIVILNIFLHELMVSFFGVVTLNKGISFGLRSNGIEILTLLLLGLIFYWYWIKNSKCLVLVVSGGFVNLLDRVRFNGVRDYWEVPLLDVFNNINDNLIFVGLAIYLFTLLWKKK